MTPLKVSFPVILGYLPVAITFGLLASAQGISFWITLSLSLFLFAGSAQFVALTFISLSSFALPQIFLTIWLVNLRHFILSLAYLPHTKGWSLLERIRLFFFLTDETFAVLVNEKTMKKDALLSFKVAFYNYLAWNGGTIIGYFGGELIPDPKKFGLDFALVALFVAIICLFIKKKSHLVTLSSSFILAYLFYGHFELGKNAIIFSALIASFIGFLWEKQQVSSQS